MPRVSNGNLILLKWQNIHVISNIKYTGIYIYIHIYIYIYSKTWASSLIHIQHRLIQNSFQGLSKEVISLKLTIFTKIPILDVSKGSEYVRFPDFQFVRTIFSWNTQKWLITEWDYLDSEVWQTACVWHGRWDEKKKVC